MWHKNSDGVVACQQGDRFSDFHRNAKESLIMLTSIQITLGSYLTVQGEVGSSSSREVYDRFSVLFINLQIILGKKQLFGENYSNLTFFLLTLTSNFIPLFAFTRVDYFYYAGTRTIKTGDSRKYTNDPPFVAGEKVFELFG